MNKPKSATHYVLLSLIPFTEANLNLSFKPNKFFNELESLHKISANASRNALNRAHKSGLIEYDEQNIPRLTEKGHKKLRPYVSAQLEGSQVMVVFDIPEQERWKRRHMRTVLREFSFKQVQKSVWMSRLDCAGYIREEIDSLGLQGAVKIFEARPVH